MIVNDIYSSFNLLKNALEKRGFSVELQKFENRQVMLFSKKGSQSWISPIENISYPLNNGYLEKVIVRNKTLSAEVANYFDLPIVLSHSLVPEDEVDQKQFEDWIYQYKKLVVKPETGTLSRGLTMDIVTYKELKEAISTARESTRGNPNVLIQQQVEGEEVRFLVVNGCVKAALLRQPTRIVGDGESSISELIDLENVERLKIKNTFVKYPMVTEDMITRRIDSSEILPSGAVKRLNDSSMISGGASIYNVIDKVDASYVDAVERFAKGVGAGFLAVDMFVDDYTKTPALENRYYFNEINSSPVLKLCYSCRDGRHYDVVSDLTEAIDNRLKVK